MSCASKRGAHAKDKCFCPEKMRILETFSFLQFAFSFGWIPFSFSPPCVWSRGYLGARISGSLYSTTAESSRLAGLIFTGGKEGDFNQSYVGHALVFCIVSISITTWDSFTEQLDWFHFQWRHWSVFVISDVMLQGRLDCRGDKLNSMYRCWAVQGRGLVKGYQGGYPPISRCTGMPAGTWGQGTSDQSKQSSSSTPCRLIWTEQFVGWITCRMDLTYTVAWFRKELLREDILCSQNPLGQSARSVLQI